MEVEQKTEKQAAYVATKRLIRAQKKEAFHAYRWKKYYFAPTT